MNRQEQACLQTSWSSKDIYGVGPLVGTVLALVLNTSCPNAFILFRSRAPSNSMFLDPCPSSGFLCPVHCYDHTNHQTNRQKNIFFFTKIIGNESSSTGQDYWHVAQLKLAWSLTQWLWPRCLRHIWHWWQLRPGLDQTGSSHTKIGPGATNKYVLCIFVCSPNPFQIQPLPIQILKTIMNHFHKRLVFSPILRKGLGT